MLRSLAGVAVAVVWLLGAGTAAAGPLQIEHDVLGLDGMTGDRFTWTDADGSPRVGVLAHNDGQVGPAGTRGGELREYRYQLPGGGTRVVRAAPTSGFSGFGYVVSHPADEMANCTGGGDPSSLGHFTPGQFRRVFEGRHHAIFRFTQPYPRYCTTSPPAQEHDLPVTIDWLFADGRSHPLWAVTWDLSGVPVNALMDDSRAPYGELLFDGSANEADHSPIAGVAWGERYKFSSTSDPVTYDSEWTWDTLNSVPYVKLWTTAVDATMGTVLTQTTSQQDAGGYFGFGRWGTTSALGNACTVAIGGVDTLMPCDFNWPYQSINFSLNPSAPTDPTNNTRLAWGTNFGFLGQQQYPVMGSADPSIGGPVGDGVSVPYGMEPAYASGYPRKSYSTFVVLGLDSLDPVGAQVAQIETVQNTTLTATVGTVLTSGPAGIDRTDPVAYAPAGWNHVYAAWAVQAAANTVDVNFAVGGGGTLADPLLVVSGWTANRLPATLLLDGASLAQDVDYFPSLRASAQELWITLNRPLTGLTNRVQVLPGPAPLVTAAVSQSLFSPGDAFVASLTADNAGQSGAADFYVGVLLPDGNTVLAFTGGGPVFGSLSALAALPPVVAGVPLAAAFSVAMPSFFTYGVTGSEPAGGYLFFVAAVRAGGFADGAIDPGDILALAVAPFTVAP